jgi:transposase
MQTKRDKSDNSMMLLPSLEEFIPEDHYLRKINHVLDLSFVHEVVADKYCQDNGRPSIDPEVVVRLFLLQAIEGIGSVRRLMQRAHVDLAYRWFIGYRVDEKLPDHSTLSRALDRFGDEVFNELFIRSVSQCQKSGLIEGQVLHLDATTIRADLDSTRVNQPDSPDKDARFGRFPGGKVKPGYKQHSLADGKKRVVVGVTVTPANSPDDSTMTEMVDDVSVRLGSSPEALCADAAYGSGRNSSEMEKRNIRLVSPPQKPKTYTGDKYFTVEDFEYDESNDQFTCPDGHNLKHVYIEKKRGRKVYRAHRTACRSCPLKSQCTIAERRSIKVSPYHASLVRLRADYKTESFRELYRQRSPVIEGVFAEAKQWHGLGRAWRRGLSKMLVQCLLVATVINLKRLGAVSDNLFNLKVLFNTILDAIETIMNTTERYFSIKIVSFENVTTDVPKQA